MPAGCMRVVCGLYASCYAAVCELHARSYASCMPGCMCLSCSPVVSIAPTKGFVHTKSVPQGAAKKSLAPLRLWSSSPDGTPAAMFIQSYLSRIGCPKDSTLRKIDRDAPAFGGGIGPFESGLTVQFLRF